MNVKDKITCEIDISKDINVYNFLSDVQKSLLINIFDNLKI